ncbi:MAG: hypothetical protein M3296_04975 [Actinomycetota bacterium]|nr:hypothetical protein [Actinomycetota bacterium]
MTTTRNVRHRHERLRLETARYRITGTVTLARDGYRSRLSDLLNATERDFLSLTDATVEPLDGDGVADDDRHHQFIAVARRHIVFALALGPADPPGPEATMD